MERTPSSIAPMTSKQLMARIGLKPKSRSTPQWLNVRLKFIGGGNYLLGTEPAEVCLDGRNGGFCLMFKRPVTISADYFLGESIDSGVLHDVRLEFPKEHAMPELSLAALMPGVYPQHLVRGTDIVVK